MPFPEDISLSVAAFKNESTTVHCLGLMLMLLL